MKVQKPGNFTVAMVASLLLAACSSSPVAPPVAETATPAVTARAANPSTGPASAVTAPLAAYLDPQNPLYQQRSVYFDFNSATVKPQAMSLMELHGKFLASHPSVAIKIEGNTDERGGSEYNLALGQKRAEAVSRALKILGVKDAQMEAVSFGKEKPKALGHDEASYAQNRRADLDYPVR